MLKKKRTRNKRFRVWKCPHCGFKCDNFNTLRSTCPDCGQQVNSLGTVRSKDEILKNNTRVRSASRCESCGRLAVRDGECYICGVKK